MLRQGMVDGRWRGTLPGRQRLADELGCSHGTVESALQQLAREGWLVPQGQGRRRRIKVPSGQTVARTQVKRVRVLLYDKPAHAQHEKVTLLARLQEAGYAAQFALKSLEDLNMDVRRVARFVQATPSDAWIVGSASREILEWFAGQPVPTMAMFGRFTGVPIAATCPRKAPAMLTAVRRLAELGHRRIVLITTPDRISPHPAIYEQAFLDELQRLGLSAGAYNLPVVDKRTGGLTGCLRALFQLTPPTAIFVGDSEHFMGTMQFLARRGIRVPEDVSLVAPDPVPDFRWCDPPISHLRWDAQPLIRHILRWVDRVVRQDKRDIRQRLYDAEFVEGGSIGPAPVR